MHSFDTHDNAEVARQVELLIFDIQTDPEGAYLDEPAPLELPQALEGDAEALAASYPEIVVRVSQTQHLAVSELVIDGIESRTVLRAVLAGLLYGRASEKDPELREAMHAYFMQASRRLDVLVARDGF